MRGGARASLSVLTEVVSTWDAGTAESRGSNTKRAARFVSSELSVVALPRCIGSQVGLVT